MKLMSYAESRWIEPQGAMTELMSAVDGRVVASCSSAGLPFGAMADYARRVGGPALRQMTFHQRAEILKKLALYLNERKDALYELNYDTGATRKDGWIDIEGGIGTLFAYASKGRRELPNQRFLLDGAVENLSKGGTFVGRHIVTPLQGVAVHINAFNFPCWGMLEKLAPTFLAGVPAIVKPASATAWLAEAMFRQMIDSNLLPPGAVQLIVGSTGDLLDHLTGQDVVSFTGSIDTSSKLRNHPTITREAVRFIAERDSLNASILGLDTTPESPEFDLFVKEVVREMTTKAGQKCTAIRRAFVPANLLEATEKAIAARLAKVVVGDPRRDEVTMGALASRAQLADVRGKIATLRTEATLVFGDPEQVKLAGGDAERGAFLSPVLLRCERPDEAVEVHASEPFGPVATVMPYRDLDHAVQLVKRGEGSLVASAFTYDDDVADALIHGAAAYHGRMILVDRDCFKESTGHGSPLPGLVHGGPGRAGGGEELGGIRGVTHYMQRTALQGSPKRLAQLTRSWIKGAPEVTRDAHPFRKNFEELVIGETFHTKPRTVTLEDVEHFANFTGDTFYAHMDEEAAAANPFFPGRVAHGYLVLSFAAGLFVDPAPGPVLANYGLDNLRFVKPVSPGDTIQVRLTAKEKNKRNADYGEVRWDVLITNQNDEQVAAYDLLTMNAQPRAVYEAEERATVAASPEQVWALVRDFGGFADWHPSFASSKLEGEGAHVAVGAVRALDMPKSGITREELTALDETGRAISYRIVEGPLPVRDYRSTMRVVAKDGGSEIVWTAQFDAPVETGDDLLKGVRKIVLKRGLDALAKKFSEPRS
jgi:oxepin-CoA hydrolase / 3-oxo-5,6-dehydrosuberyl-CoA semialdehyde dehydrogenase